MGNTLEQQPLFINNIDPNNNAENHNEDIANGSVVSVNTRPIVPSVFPSKTKKTKTFKNPTSLKKNTLKLVKT